MGEITVNCSVEKRAPPAVHKKKKARRKTFEKGLDLEAGRAAGKMGFFDGSEVRRAFDFRRFCVVLLL